MSYVIKVFPRLLARPPIDPTDFTYKQIRDKIIIEGKDDNGTVRFAARRVLIAHLTFEQKSANIELVDGVEQKFFEIANRNVSHVRRRLRDEKNIFCYHFFSDCFICMSYQ